MFPTNLSPGFYRDEWEEGDLIRPYGKVSWHRKNINVQLRSTFTKEIQRFIFNLEGEEFSAQDIAKAKSLLNKPRVAHVFNFGNQKKTYFHGIGDEGYPCLTKKVAIESWMLNRSFSRYRNYSWITFLGDATGGTHPLAAIGAYLSFKNSVDFFKYCALTHHLKQVANELDKSKVAEQALYWVECKMAVDCMMVFLQARLCAHYSD